MNSLIGNVFACAGLLMVPVGLVQAGLTAEQRAKLPPPAKHEISFAREISPLLEKSCSKCHGKGKAKGGFSIETREKLLAGGDSGATVVIGKSADSYLV
ncbi:MAG: mono/diheme cytochrome c family protein, partial [Limisphaerales bacterium]